MRKVEFIYRELLFQALEKKALSFTQSDLSSRLDISLTNVNHALQPLRRMNAIKINPRNFSIVNARKILFYWASIRNLQKDIIYSTRAELPIREIEKNMPDDAVFTAYSAYKFKFRDAPADYSEVYVYAPGPEEMKRRFPPLNKNPNLFVLEKDALMEKYGKTAGIAQLFVDLWNLHEWYAKDFLKSLEERINALLE
ncbi:MAG: hypothetical protein J4415_02365 [Candidatus Diapherotrites archaeon]|uniref:Winged helix-turn-helix domain-containing protein n=1 Tax=Candidatus Iainarchaeum sp. TaxID=3101447 RepID=A0A8T4KWD4_9ARCH|nr:hypothetical protein [Candidatus Diapherotrites archaeon]